MFHLSLLRAFLFYLFVKQVSSQSQCSKVNFCVSDFKESSCPVGETLQYDPEVLFGCCPICRPGTPEAGKCRPPASCLPDGSYAPVQCKGDLFTGRCFCSDEKGKRIFGQTWRSDAKEMSCACSRRRAELEAAGKLASLHCTPTGDYEPLQCNERLCWCAQPKTGQAIVPPVRQQNLKLLPCSECCPLLDTGPKDRQTTDENTNTAAFMGKSYLRRCESVVLAMAAIHKEQADHGTKFLSSSLTLCDYDGSYGSYKIQGTSAYCTGRDGAVLGAWSVEASQIAGMNCNCARDTSIYFPNHGMTVVETCESNGNYKTQQNIGDYLYCVDSDGYPIDCTSGA